MNSKQNNSNSSELTKGHVELTKDKIDWDGVRGNCPNTARIREICYEHTDKAAKLAFGSADRSVLYASIRARSQRQRHTHSWEELRPVSSSKSSLVVYLGLYVDGTRIVLAYRTDWRANCWASNGL